MYHFTECGLDNVYLKNGYTLKDTPSGTVHIIHGMDNLLDVIGETLATQDARLTGREFRFLRIELDLSQSALGQLMEKSDQAIAKWEKEDNGIPLLADKAIRDLYLESKNKGPVAGLLKELSRLDKRRHMLEIKLQETQSGWAVDDTKAAC